MRIFIYCHSGLNLNTGEVVAVKKFERAKISPQQIGSVMVLNDCTCLNFVINIIEV